MGYDGYDNEQESPYDDLANGGRQALNDAVDAARQIKKHADNSAKSPSANGGQKQNQPTGQPASAGTRANGSSGNSSAAKSAADASKGAADAADASQKAANASKAADAAKKAETAKKGAEVAKGAAQASGEAAATAGGAAATGGLSLAVQAGVEAGKGAISAAGKLASGDTSTSSLGKFILAILIIILALGFSIGYSNTNISSSQNENNEEVQYANVHDKIGRDDKAEDYVMAEEDAIDTAVDYFHPYGPSSLEYKQDTEDAITDAFYEQATEKIVKKAMDNRNRKGINFILKKLSRWKGDLNGFEYKNLNRDDDDPERGDNKTKLIFWENPFPYCKYIKRNGVNTSGGSDEYYSIGDFLYTMGYSEDDFFNHLTGEGKWKEIPEDKLFDDVNFAEFTVLMSQGPLYQTYGGTYQTYKELFETEEKQRLLFEMTVENMKPFFYGWETYIDEETGEEKRRQHAAWGSYEHCSIHGDDMDLCDIDDRHFCYRPVVRPYGLRELYYAAECDNGLAKDNEQPGNQDSYNYEGIANYIMLDYSERYDRVYARMDPNDDYDGYLGTSFESTRSKLSPALIEWGGYTAHTIDGKKPKTGRSPNWFIPVDELINSDKLKEMIANADDWATEELDDNYVFTGDLQQFLDQLPDGKLKDMISLAFTKLGADNYVWGSHGPNKFDCSGYVQYLYKNIYGIDIGGSTRSQIANSNLQSISYSELQPGDLIYRDHSVSGKKGMHVAMYIGGGKIIHAKGKKWGIVISDMYDANDPEINNGKGGIKRVMKG